MLPQKRGHPDSTPPRLPKLSDVELKIYNLVKATENSGIWVADITKQAGINGTARDKILKSLVAKNLIKHVVSIKSKSKKIYMAVEFEPSKEISGGSWYQNGVLDIEMIRILRQLCGSFIDKHKIATVDMLLEEITRSGAFTVQLTLQQILEIVRMMVLDKEVEELRSTGTGETAHLMKGRTCYRRSTKGKDGPKRGALSSIPCGVCPRIDECTPDGVISPINCVYYNKWLGLDF